MTYILQLKKIKNFLEIGHRDTAKIKEFFNGMCAFGKKAYLRIESILSNPMNRRAVIAVVILLGFVILAMSFGYIK